MKQKHTINLFLLILIFLLFSAGNLLAQRIVNVAQGFGTLNTAIDSDTTETGERVDLNTIYVLEDGGTYLLNGSIENRFPLHIEAEAGANARPKLIPAVATGGESSRAFRIRDDLTIKGLYVTNEDELGQFKTRIIRASAADARIVIDNCQLDKDGQSGIRLDDDGAKIFMTNSIISNIGIPADPNNGRGIDDRGNDIDTLVMVNNTFYNITSRVLRDGGGIIGYADVRNNTFMNIGQFVFSFGEVIEATFNNNLVINGGFYGRNKNTVEGNGLAASNAQWLQFNPLGSDLDSLGFVQNIDISNNNFYLNPALAAEYPDSVEIVPVLDSLATVIVENNGTAATLIDEEIAFTTSPATETSIVSVFWTDPGNTPDWDNSSAPFDFSYSNSAASYTHGTDGNPLGDLNWFGLASALQDEILISNPKSFRLQQNYPNPFNPTTTISYNLQNASNVSLTIYNVLGKKVRTLLSQKQGPGDYEVVWDGKDEFGINLASGIFFYTIQTEKIKQTKRMLLLK